MVEDGFAILKVVTFALREALYGLDEIARVLSPESARENLPALMERLMLADPGHWQKHCNGTPDEMRVQRHLSYSDRIRYY